MNLYLIHGTITYDLFRDMVNSVNMPQLIQLGIYAAEETLNKRYGETYQTDFFQLINDPNYDVIYKNVK